MATVEPRTFRNWPAIGYAGVCLPLMTVAGFLAGPPFWWFAWFPYAAMLVASARQYVTVSTADVELHDVVRRERLALWQIHRVSVRRSHWRGWRIRLHHGAEHVDTYRFFELISHPFVVAHEFATPPANAPAALKEMYAFLAARIARAPTT